jgi:hypothetical protein
MAIYSISFCLCFTKLYTIPRRSINIIVYLPIGLNAVLTLRPTSIMTEKAIVLSILQESNTDSVELKTTIKVY